jgi:hypothetical protein
MDKSSFSLNPQPQWNIPVFPCCRIKLSWDVEEIHLISSVDPGCYLRGVKPDDVDYEIWSELKSVQTIMHDIGHQIKSGWSSGGPIMKKVSLFSNFQIQKKLESSYMSDKETSPAIEMVQKIGKRKRCQHKDLNPSNYQRKCRECFTVDPCSHRPAIHTCNGCKKERLCKHGREAPKCIDCGGSSTCQHKMQRAKCKDCGGASICKHQILRYYCLECDGKGICEHTRIRSQCLDCGAGGICEHKKIRTVCVICDGGSLCHHKKPRSKCVDCEGGSICKHKRLKHYCVQCNGNGICIHKIHKSKCVDCGGGSKCKHKNPVSKCPECCSVKALLELGNKT